MSQVYDGRNAGSPLLGRFCGTQIPPQINSTTNDIFLRMVSDMSNQGRGFSLQFNAGVFFLLKIIVITLSTIKKIMYYIFSL